MVLAMMGQESSYHPRPRGEHVATVVPVSPDTGSPPPARGAQVLSKTLSQAVRITPARAGSTLMLVSGQGQYIGSPPPARGALIEEIAQFIYERITPARAGSTSFSLFSSADSKDHPRPRGEHEDSAFITFAFTGSPPPARGAPPPGRGIFRTAGITPARAGSTYL